MSFRSARLAAGLSVQQVIEKTKGIRRSGIYVGDRTAASPRKPLAGGRRALRLHGGRAIEAR